MRKIVYLLIVIASVSGGRCVLGQTLRSGAEPDYPPLSIVQTNGAADGFAVEVLKAVLAEVGLETSFEIAPWNQLKTELAEGKLDVLPLVGRTPEREALFDFTVPYLTLHGALFVRTDETAIQSLSDLSGKRIAVMKGDNAEEYVLRARLSENVISTPTFEDAFRMLSNGEADAVIAQKLMGVSLLKELGISNIKVAGKPNEEFKQDFCFAVQKGNAKLLALLNEGLALATADGRLQDLKQKWLGAAGYDSAVSRVLVYVSDRAYPPYEFLDDKGRPSGFNIDLLRALSRETGIDIAFELLPWSEVRRKADAGELDITAMLYSRERDRTVDFSTPVLLSAQAVFARKDSPPWPGTEELNRFRLSVQNGDLAHDWLRENGITNRLTVTSTPQEALRLLAEGNVDFSLGALIQGRYWIKQYGWNNLMVVEPNLLVTDYCFAVPQGRTKLLGLINAGLLDLKLSGEYRRIYDEWLGPFDPDASRKHIRKLILNTVTTGLLLSGVTAIWIFILRREVCKRTNDLLISEERFALATEAGGIGVWDWDIVQDRLIWDDSMFDLFGIRKEDFLGAFEDWRACIHPDDIKQAMTEVTAAENDESPFDTDFRIIRPNGEIRNIRAFAKVIRDESGKPIRMIGTNQDITDRKKAESQIHETLNRLRKIADQVPGVIYQYRLRPDGSSCFPYASDKIRDIYRVTPEQVREDASNVFAVIHPDDYAGVAESIQKSAEDMTLWKYDYRVRFDEGTVRWLSGQAVPQKEPDGSVLWHGFITDITEQRKTEERLQFIIKNSTNLFYSHTPDGVLTYISPQVKQILGYDPQEVMTLWLELVTDHPANQKGIQLTEQAIRTGTPLPAYELQLKHKDGRPVWVEVHEAPVVEDGKTIAIVGSLTDITSRKDAEEKIHNHLNELERFNKASVGRELRMIELKKEVNALCREMGRQEPYG